jgi:hypothetical protein
MSVFVINPFVLFVPEWVYQGSTNAFVAGGNRGTSPPVTNINITTHQRYPFASDSTVSTVGSLSPGKAGHSGAFSKTHAYYISGYQPPLSTLNAGVQKFSFASPATATSVLNLTVARSTLGGVSSEAYGYGVGGGPAAPTYSNVIDKFPFASDADAVDVGDLVTAEGYGCTHSSPTNGYWAGGRVNQNITRFPFATDVNAITVGALGTGRFSASGQSSSTTGFVCGGQRTPTPTLGGMTTKQYFRFASDGNGTSAGTLSSGLQGSVGASSTTSGYLATGLDPTLARTSTRQKFPFATDVSPSSTITGLTTVRSDAAGTHN